MSFLRTLLMFVFVFLCMEKHSYSQDNLSLVSNKLLDITFSEAKCALMPSIMSCRFFRKSEVELCEAIKGFKRGVETFDNYSGSLKEAKRRGLDCGVKEDNKTIIVSNQTKDPNKRPLAKKSNLIVCNTATMLTTGIMKNGKFGHVRVWNKKKDNYVSEAQYRGLNCGVDNKSQNFQEVVESLEKKLLPDKKSKTTNLIKSISETNKSKQERFKLQQQASIERAKRLEEERKRKALEKEIAELRQKNKELQQPKKKQPPKPKSSSGSGFFISKLGHIITNQHVVNQCTRITVGDRIDKQVPAKLLETDKRNDLALLKTTSLKLASAETKSLIQKLSIEIVPLATGGLMRGNDVKLGEDVLVAGFPYGDIFSKNIKVTKGIVSSTTGIKDDSGQFQLDAAVQPGNSGGPIYDKYGNIVGVVVAQLNKFKMAKAIGSMPENVNFGIKASTVKQFLNETIPTRWSERNKEISTTKLSEIAQKQTVMVVCHR